jgi:hypothetical protein
MRPGTCSGRSRFCRSHVVADPQNREVVSRTPSVALSDACEPSEGIDRSALLSHLTVFPLPCRWHRCSQLVPSGERTSESDAKAAAFAKKERKRRHQACLASESRSHPWFWASSFIGKSSLGMRGVSSAGDQRPVASFCNPQPYRPGVESSMKHRSRHGHSSPHL